MAAFERSGFAEFDRQLALVRRTRAVLDRLLDAGELPAGDADYLAETTLPHVESIEAGMRGWLRAEMAGLDELRYLILRVAAVRVEPPQTPAEATAARVEADREQQRMAILGSRLAPADALELAALAHAQLVFALLPGLPADEVRFPSAHRSYADIARPRGPAELLERVEELERELWRIASGRAVRRADAAFRRTYGFFDAAERLDERTFGPAA